jgi:hypothetical protein
MGRAPVILCGGQPTYLRMRDSLPARFAKSKVIRLYTKCARIERFPFIGVIFRLTEVHPAALPTCQFFSFPVISVLPILIPELFGTSSGHLRERESR